MQDAIHFRETGGKWFRLMRIVIVVAAVMVALLGIFSVYHPRKLWLEGSDWAAFIAIVAIAGIFAASLGVFGLWRQWRKPLRLSVSTRGVAIADRQPLIPWAAVDCLAIHWRGQRFETLGPLRRIGSMRSGVSLLIYARENVAQPAARGIEASFNRYWYGTPHMIELGLLEGSIDDVLGAVQMFAPADVLARSRMLKP
jgi:hypothetical protein